MAGMKRILILTVLLTLVGSACPGGEYPYRWVYVSRSLRADSDVADIKGIVETGSAHGLNGMVLSAGLDMLDKQPADYLARLEQVKQICKDNAIEIIPIIFSAGYGGAVLSYDKNLAAGISVTDAVFLVEGERAHLVPDDSANIANGGFEEFNADQMAGYRFHDRPGEVSFADKQVFNGGKASLRFENFGKYEHGHARVMQEIKVRPHRCYRITCFVKTDALEPPGSFQIQVLTADGRSLAPWDPRIPGTSDWRKVVMGFNSLEYDTARIYLGAWGGNAGRFWVDDLSIEEVGLLNVLRRDGTPVTVKSEQTGAIYEEGRDFAAISDPSLNFRFDHDGPSIKILPGGRIKDGQRLMVSYYHGMGVNSGQVTVCMSEPKVYEIWARQAELIQKHLAPKKWLLSMDEVRAGGGCTACKERAMTMGQILGDCITRQVRLIRNVNPEAEILTWSDMLDPNHNAHGDYYLVDGDFTGSWKYIPKDLVIVCWYYEKRNESLKFFSSLGFKTLAGAYYDGDTLDNPKGWLETLDRTPAALGIMYTTWQNKYELIGPFGDLVSGKGN
ncbi:MAG TPA: hypothetical protein VJJ98_10280 [Sedimentisphaerales bacterium]|nr:hypothetical protein [Sedimentisphaerales bacterium]